MTYNAFGGVGIIKVIKILQELLAIFVNKMELIIEVIKISF